MTTSARIAYLRDSSAGLDLARQRELIGPADRTWTELQPPGTSHDRPVLREALDALQGGDTLAVASADRLARSLRDLQDLVEQIIGAGARLELCAPGITLGPEDARLVAAVVAADAAMAAQRQAEAVVHVPAYARVSIERPRELSDGELHDVRLQLEAGMPSRQVAREHGVPWEMLRRLLEQPELPLE